MLSLNMVIIASMIGAGGLGFDVLNVAPAARYRRRAWKPGIAIVVLAVALDRISQAYALRAGPRPTTSARTPIASALRCRCSALGVAAAALACSASPCPALQTYPESLQVSTASYWDALVEWLNVNFFDTFETIKTAMLLNVLAAGEALPAGAALAVGDRRRRRRGLGGRRARGGDHRRRLSASSSPSPATGKPAMVTVYLVGVSVAVAALIGIPIGIAAGLNRRAMVGGAGGDRHAADAAELRLSHPGRHALPRRRLHRDDRRHPLRARPGDPLHGARHPRGQSGACRGGDGDGHDALAAALEDTAAAGAARRSCSASTRRSCWPFPCWSSPRLSARATLGRKSISRSPRRMSAAGIVAGLGVAMIAMIADRMMTASAERMKRRLGLG